MADSKIMTVNSPIRLDLFLVKEWDHLGREQIQHMVSNGRILVNDIKARKIAQRLNPGYSVTVYLPVPEKSQLRSDVIPLSIIFEDDKLLVIDKPAGLSIKTLARQQQISLASSLVSLRPMLANIGGVGHAGIVTPLAEAASGLVLIAKCDQTYHQLRRHLKRQRIAYTFSGMVEGHLRGVGVIEEPIGNARHERERLQVSREGRAAKTSFRAQRHFRDNEHEYTLLIIKPETSRKHQMRVHLSWYGFPLVGDKRYGSRYQNLLFDRLFLHLGILEFPNPQNGELMHVESSLSPELQSVLTYLIRPKR